MTADVQCIVIGAGVVGLAIARELSLAGLEVLVAEAGEGIGVGVSSRSSEVIHAGIYYPNGSLKARLCVQGKEKLYAYCENKGVPHRRLGKLLVATSDEDVQNLDGILRNAHGNGVDDLQRLDANEVMAMEPALQCKAALLSPSTGIIDSHAFMLAFQGDAQAAGAEFVFHCPALSARVVRLSDGTRGFEVDFGGEEAITLRCRYLINAAGLGAVSFARNIDGLASQDVPPAYLCKGSYYSCTTRAPFTHLVYPVPRQSAGLGVHLTLDLGGQARFGPDVEWIEEENYDVDPARSQDFYAAVRSYWPDLPDDALQPGYAGIRPKISGPNEPAADFRIDTASKHGIEGLVNLFGIESPGLTSSMAIAEVVAQAVLTTNHPN